MNLKILSAFLLFVLTGLLPLVSAYQYNAERQNGIYTKDRYILNVYLDLSGGLLNMCLNKFGGIPLD
jgi:hypothetical protein